MIVENKKFVSRGWIESVIGDSFEIVGYADIDQIHGAFWLRRWVSAGMYGTMNYMPRTSEVRLNIKKYLPWSRSFIVLGKSYYTDQPVSGDLNVSRYSVWRDYHKALYSELKPLLTQIENAGYRAKLLVDTQPVSDRDLAMKSGLGWIGKNTMLINRTIGSFFFISTIATDAKITRDEVAYDNYCGICTRCIDLCPTKAIISPYVLDSKRCISYLTIEYKGIIPRHLRRSIGNYLFGCDICQDVCPWNRYAKLASTSNNFFSKLNLGNAIDIAFMEEDEYMSSFQGTPLMRIKYQGLIRNAVIVCGNTGKEKAYYALKKLIKKHRNNNLLLVHIVWSLGEIVKRGFSGLRFDLYDTLVNISRSSASDDVIEEINLVLKDLNAGKEINYRPW